VSGDAAPVETAMKTLETVSDTFLPVNEIAQFSVPDVFRLGRGFLDDYKARIESLRNTAASILGTATGARSLGGFYSVIPFERSVGDEDLAIEILTEEHVLVHPGYLYDIEGRRLVLSFVGDPERVRDGLRRLTAHLRA
jgi:aspartate/methionine/tyrosine aminotransferase